MMERYAYSIFCDDIRHEVGRKMSMMGIYSGELQVAAIPTLLPKLCIAVFCNTAIDQPFKSLTIRADNNGTMLLETSIPHDDLSAMQAELAAQKSTDNPLKSIAIGTHLILSPFSINQVSILTVTVIADGDEIIAGKLRIRHTPDLVL